MSRKLCLRNSTRGSSSQSLTDELHLTTGEHNSQNLLTSAHLWRPSVNDPRLPAGEYKGRTIGGPYIFRNSFIFTSSPHIITKISLARVDNDGSHSGEGGSFSYFLGLERNLLISDSALHILWSMERTDLLVFIPFERIRNAQRSSLFLVRRSLAA
ncbi:uncharacterized protein EAF01_006030 [Botrytis porri]|uniref:uncharacterized protein n=1 Tax=Botrytis porri TaxID=87229 RepID=UPI0018FF5720|nr:uncharacterized protein EAF01_006030 [Botrytis porri]KAF7905509.1 hypothetical protein EAF01_006030 [Botrytis porri]